MLMQPRLDENRGRRKKAAKGLEHHIGRHRESVKKAAKRSRKSRKY